MTCLFLASSVWGCIGSVMNVYSDEHPQGSNTGVSGTILPESLRWSEDSSGASTFEATNIVIVGATLLPAERLKPLYSHLTEGPFKIRDIQGVMRQIARLYKQEGFYGVEIQLDLDQLANNIVSINVVEPADLKGDIIAKSKGRELKTPKKPMVKVKPKTIKPEPKKPESPREKVIKKAISELKEPPKTRLEKRLSPDNLKAQEIQHNIYLLPEMEEAPQAPSKPKGEIKLLDEAPVLRKVPEAPPLIQENVDPPPQNDSEEKAMGDSMSVYTPSSVDDKKKSRSEKRTITIGSYVSTGKPIRPVRQRPVVEENIIAEVADEPQNVAGDAVFTRVSSISQDVPDREDIVFAERAEDELLILEMVVNSRVRDSGILAYLADDSLLVPLYSFVEAMGFPIDVKPGAGYAQGWFIDEKNTFQLSTADSDIFIAGKQLKYPLGKVEVHMDDIYVDRQVLEEWFGMRVSMDMSSLRLIASIDTTLPYEELQERREIWERVAESREGSKHLGPDIEHIDIPHKLASLPAMKVTTSYDYSESSNDDRSDSLNGTIQAEGDFLYMTSNISASYKKVQDEEIEISNVNVALRRIDDDGHLPLNATLIEAGDVNVSSLPLISSGGSGRGISFSRKPKGYVSNPDDFVIRGVAPIGWDVELYVNQNLIDFQTVDGDAEYEFADLPLRKGNNILKVVMYGLDGEKRERTEHFFVGPGILANGDYAYEFSAIESSQKLIPAVDTPGVEDKRPRFLLSGEYGFSRDLSFVGGVYHGPILDDSEPESAVSGGLRLSLLKSMYLRTDFTSQSMGGESGNLELQWVRNNKSLSAGTTRHWSFLQTEEDDLNRTFIRWDQSLYPSFMAPISYSIGYEKETAILAPTVNRISTKLSTNFFGFAVNNDLISEKIKGTEDATLRGTFTTSRNIAGVQMRARALYEPKADDIVQTLTVTGQKSVGQDVNIKGSINKTFGETGVITGNANVNVKLNKLTVGVNAGASEEGDINAGITLSSNLLPSVDDEGHISYETSGDKPGFNVARLNVRTFLDRDGNNIYSKGDDLLENVSINDARRGNSSLTNDKGVATLKNLIPFTNTNISLDVSTLPDIYYVPVKQRVQVTPRPGLAGLIDLPITVKGEITGDVYVDGERQNTERAIIEVIDLEGNVIEKIYAEKDGFFIIGGLSVGKYLVRTLETPNFIPVTPPIPIEITFDEPVIDGLEFYTKALNLDVYE
jgi:hypothetical protein